MKYISPKYELCSMQANDVITASSIQGNNCTITHNQPGAIDPDSTVTQVNGFFDKLVRPEE